jgi:Fic family protein
LKIFKKERSKPSLHRIYLSQSALTVDFLIAKNKLYKSCEELLNERQKKVLERIFREGIKGFEGGLSAEKYLAITKTSRATATRDLQELLEFKVFKKTGEGRWTRYFLNFNFILN